MITCITLNIDGTEAYRETRPKRWVPRNGFERGIDGCFYKQLGNPLIISDIEKADKINAEQELRASFREQLDEEKKVENRPAGFDPILGLRIIHPIQKITFKQFRRVVSWTFCTRSSSRTSFDSVKFSVNILELPEFDIFKTFKKVEINFPANLIKVWLDKAEHEGPDYYIVKPFTAEDIKNYTTIA